MVSAALSGQTSTAPATQPPAVERIQAEARSLRPLFKSDLVQAFLAGADELPHISPRTLYRSVDKTRWLSATAWKALTDEARRDFNAVTLDERVYYNTKYGTPLAYARPLEILAQSGLHDVSGKRIVDYGYGTIGHLRLLAGLGADAVGVDVDPLLTALYGEPGDVGTTRGHGGREGSITLVNGLFPADEATRRAIGGGYDLFISKNTLKNGYIHPSQPVEKRLLVDLGVDDAAFVQAVHDILKPGGRAIVYNLSPAPSKPGEPFKHWADGRCPFPRELWEAAGFRVIAFDQNDDAAARAMAHALGWDSGPNAMDLEGDLFALYTLVEKRR